MLTVGDKNLVTNYRPITIIPGLSKVFEKALTKRISPHLEDNGLLNEHQSGFCRGVLMKAAISTLIDITTTQRLSTKETISSFVFLLNKGIQMSIFRNSLIETEAL